MNHSARTPHILPSLLPGSLGAVVFVAIALTNHVALAGDAKAPPAADQARCDAMGEGFFAVKGSNACIKISGYITAGADFATPGAKGSAASAPKLNGGLNSQTAVSAEMRMDTPLGPGRLYVQIGHDSYYRP